MDGIKQWLQKIYAVHIRRDKNATAYYRYVEEGGEALRLNYPLGKDSIIIDVGGYIGDFVADMTKKFDCNVDVFEPVSEYAETISKRFSSNDKVQVIQAGLGAVEKEELITVEGLGSSVFVDGREEERKEKIRIVSVVDYLQVTRCSSIDLMKINIEGGEYELLSSLLDHPDMIKRIRYFQVQFHDFVPDAQEMRAEIQKKLSKTHALMWDFPYIWESWEIRQK